MSWPPRDSRMSLLASVGGCFWSFLCSFGSKILTYCSKMLEELWANTPANSRGENVDDMYQTVWRTSTNNGAQHVAAAITHRHRRMWAERFWNFIDSTSDDETDAFLGKSSKLLPVVVPWSEPTKAPSDRHAINTWFPGYAAGIKVQAGLTGASWSCSAAPARINVTFSLCEKLSGRTNLVYIERLIVGAN